MKTTALLQYNSSQAELQRDLDKRIKEQYPELFIILTEEQQRQKQLEIQKISSNKPTPEQFRSKLNLCGRWFKLTAECNPCVNENQNKRDHEKLSPLLDHKRFQQVCKIKYCPKTKCIVKRFSELFENLKTIKEFKGYKTLWHLAIGFEPIPLEEFVNNYEKYYKRYLSVLNSYFKKLRKIGIDLSGVRVFDYSFVKDGMVFPHFNIAVKPIAKVRRGIVMKQMQEVRSEMIKRQKIKTPFHLQIFKHGQKNSVLSYIAVRGVGLYKYGHAESHKNFKPKKLKESIENKEFLLLKDIMTKEQYLKVFWNRRSYTTFGSVSYGSNIRDNIIYECKKHGVLDPRTNVLFTLEEVFPKKPPDERPREPYGMKVEVINLAGHTCKSCNLNVSVKDYDFKTKSCVFCNSSSHNIKYPPAKEYERNKFLTNRENEK